jgi:hypothetical protein
MGTTEMNRHFRVIAEPVTNSNGIEVEVGYERIGAFLLIL